MDKKNLEKLRKNPHYRFTDQEIHTQEIRSDDILVTAPKVRRKTRNDKEEEKT